MFNADSVHSASPAEMLSALKSLLEGESSLLANLANTASFLYSALPDVNWCGFYLFDGKELVLGPFCGKPACVRIAIGKGVCGTAFREGTTVLVPDVHAFPGHIACDAASRSELVIPLHTSDNGLWGVLDIDSPIENRFQEHDARFAEDVVRLLATYHPKPQFEQISIVY